MYSAQVLDHFEHPRNSGDLPEASARARVENPVCGDILELAVKVEMGIIVAARFRARADRPSVIARLSHDVVAKVRNHFRIPKVGHCGTLDPNATGLLIIVLGRGTKLSEKLMASDKVYEGEAKFGETTDSFDADGQVTSTDVAMVKSNYRATLLSASPAVFGTEVNGGQSQRSRCNT